MSSTTNDTTATVGSVAQAAQRNNRRAAFRWGAFVVGMLGLQVAGGITAIVLATGDQTVAVVPNYHEKALHWDQQVALRTASQKLGWVAEMTPLDRAQDRGGLKIELRDRSGSFIDLQSGSIEIYRHARADNVARIPLAAAATGSIQLSRCFNAPGWWQVSLDVRDGRGNRFVDSQEILVAENDSMDER